MGFLFFVRSTFDKYKTSLLRIILIAVGVFLVFMFSGVGYITFQMASRTKMIFYALAFLYFGIIFIFSLKVGFLRNIIKLKKIPAFSPFTICIITMILLTLLSFIFNKNKPLNINTYISFFITLSLCWMILTTFDKRKILLYFKNIMLILSIVAGVLYLGALVSQTFIYTSYYTSDVTIFGTNIFLENGGITGLTNTYHFDIRASSIFWEPSVFGVFLIAALVCDLLTRDKFTILRGVVFVVCIVFSRSTAAILMLFPYFMLILSEFINGKKRYYILSALGVVGIIFVIFYQPIFEFLAKIMPSIFGKITNVKETSFSTRLLSFGTYLKVYLRSPIFGLGGVSANEAYYEIAGSAITSETSTFGLSIASLGICGFIYPITIFVGIIFCDEIQRSSTKLLLIGIIFLLSNVQGQSAIIALNILYFLPLSLVLLPPKATEYNKQFYENVGEQTVKDIVLPKGNNTGVSKNIFFSLVLKGAAIIIAFFTIPAYLRYFNNDDSTYGVWLTITSILTIITVFDFGMGNGLKNKLIKCISEKDDATAKTYVSTTYILTAILGFAIFLILSIVIFALPTDLLIKGFFSGQDSSLINIAFFRIGVCIILLAIGTQFCLKNINYVLQAHQRNAITGIFSLTTNVLMLLFCVIFANAFKQENKILILASAYFVLLNLPLLIANLYLFFTKYKKMSPSLSSVDFKQSKGVVSTSFKFFAVQIGTLFLWSLNEFIILFLFGQQASMVTEYTEYYRLMSLLPTILGTAIQQPFWTALSKADTEGDYKKVKSLIKSLSAITIGVVIVNIILVFMLPLVFDIWLGSSAPVVVTSKQYSFLAYSIIYVISLGFIIVCNAFSLFKTQIAMAIMGVVVKIPLLICFVTLWHINLGWEIVLLTNLVCYLPVFFLAPFEIRKYLKGRIQTSQVNQMEETK